MPTGWLRIFTHIMPINIYQSDFDCILITFVWVKENATGENDSPSKHVCMQHVHHNVFTSAAIQEPSDEMESGMKCPLERLHVNMYGPLNTMASCPWVYLPNYDPNRLVHDFGRTKYPQTWFFPFFTNLCQSIEKNLKIANEIHLDRYQSLQLARVAKWYLNTLLCSNRSELTYVKIRESTSMHCFVQSYHAPSTHWSVGPLVFKGGYDARTLKRVSKTAFLGVCFFNPWNCDTC